MRGHPLPPAPAPESFQEQEDSIDLEQWFAEGHSSDGRSWEILDGEQLGGETLEERFNRFAVVGQHSSTQPKVKKSSESLRTECTEGTRSDYKT